jgi:hypothetical protein
MLNKLGIVSAVIFLLTGAVLLYGSAPRPGHEPNRAAPRWRYISFARFADHLARRERLAGLEETVQDRGQAGSPMNAARGCPCRKRHSYAFGGVEVSPIARAHCLYRQHVKSPRKRAAVAPGDTLQQLLLKQSQGAGTCLPGRQSVWTGT